MDGGNVGVFVKDIINGLQAANFNALFCKDL